MVALVRTTLLAALLLLGTLCGVGLVLGTRNLPHTASPRAALLLGVLAALMLGCGLAAWRVYRFRDPARERQLASGLLLAAASSLLCLALAEFALSRLAPASTYARAARLSPPIFRRSRVLPFELLPGYDAPTYMREAGETIPFRVNRQGFRGPEVPEPKPEGSYRILVLGDSFAVNVAVPEESLYTVLLEQRLRKWAGGACRIEVVNAGYADGYSPDAYAAFMMQRGFALEPDLVILQYFVLNDFKDLLETEVVEERDGLPLRVRSRYRYVDDDGRFRRTLALQYAVPVLRDSQLFVRLYDLLGIDSVVLELAPLLIPGFAGDNFRPNTYGIEREHVYAAASQRPPVLQQAFERSLGYVRRLAEESRRRGVGFAVFVVPTGVQTSRETWTAFFSTPAPANWDQPEPQAGIAAGLAAAGVEVFDPLARYREGVRGRTLYLGKDANGHWTVAGNAFTADLLFEYLTRPQGPLAARCLPSP